MADDKHLSILEQGVDIWNNWRRENVSALPDLSGVDFSGVNLREINFSKTDLRESIFSETDLIRADLSGANLSKAYGRNTKLVSANLSDAELPEVILTEADIRAADFRRANLNQANLSFCNATIFGGEFLVPNGRLTGADFHGAQLVQADLSRANLSMAVFSDADLREADLEGANLWEADLSGANLAGSKLARAHLVDTNLERANVTNCSIFGISAWDLKLQNTKQSNLIITRENQSTITVDSLEVAQFIYLLLNNAKIRDVIDTVTTKVVLILGRFTPERKSVLGAIREELRNHNFIPVLFDFDVPSNRDTDETVNLLARMARFVIADLSDAKSIPQELKGIVEALPSVPVVPIMHKLCKEYGMFDHIKRYPWVLQQYRYGDENEVISQINEKIILPAEMKARELRNL